MISYFLLLIIFASYIEERSFRRFAEYCLEETIVIYVDHLLAQVWPISFYPLIFIKFNINLIMVCLCFLEKLPQRRINWENGSRWRCLNGFLPGTYQYHGEWHVNVTFMFIENQKDYCHMLCFNLHFTCCISIFK